MSIHTHALLASLLVAATAIGVTLNAGQEKAAEHVAAMKADGTVTNVVRQLASDGSICAVVGHAWRDGRPGEGDGVYFADYHPGTSYRTCRICGGCESQSITDWRSQ